MSNRFPNVNWWCDRCGANLNSQLGFDDHHYIWKCTECGYKNSISSANIYDSHDDFKNTESNDSDTDDNSSSTSFVFRATKFGWDREQEAVWFDSSTYTKDEAEAEFKPYQAVSKKGYDYTGYEYDGQKYYDVSYLGEFKNDELPQNQHDSFENRIDKKRK